MTAIDLTLLDAPSPSAQRFEMVERKGLGHPDTICDALAEQVSLALSRHYRERCGLILHHNVDKVLLCGGAAQPAFGGGDVTAPIDIFLAGRATRAFRGEPIDVDAIANEAVRAWLAANLQGLDHERHVRVQSHIRPGSPDLVELFLRQRREGTLLAKDTSIGVGFAPLTPLESTVYHLEKHLNAASFKNAHPAIGADIKIMGVRHERVIELTLACALIDRHLADLHDYQHVKADIAATAAAIARRYAEGYELRLAVNAADDEEQGSIYLTVTGTSAECGDDGEAGRGNRVNGLITPYRPMTLESAAGTNPVTHVGKLYNVVAGLIAEALVAEVPEVDEASCYLVSRIGTPITQPQLTDVKVGLPDEARLRALRPRIENIVQEQLTGLPDLAERLLDGDLVLDHWPLRVAELGWITETSEIEERHRRLVTEIESDAALTARFTGHRAFSPRVMQAMAKVPRHMFVPDDERSLAYINAPLPIGCGQTISQPYIVALMTELLQPREQDVVLEVGAGSGYQAAVLATLVKHVYSLEIVPELAERAAHTLRSLALNNVTVRNADGYAGWLEHAPFDGIVVTAAAPAVPKPLLEQLKPGGRMVIPVGNRLFGQDLQLIEKRADGQIEEKSILPVSFVPFTRGD